MSPTSVDVSEIPIQSTDVLLEDMTLYAQRLEINEMFQEYLTRIVLKKPEDPIEFLIKEIEMSPYIIRGPEKVERDYRPVAVKEKMIDRRDVNTKRYLLIQIYEKCKQEYKVITVRISQLMVFFKTHPEILLEHFPKHVNEIKRSVAQIESRIQGIIAVDEFIESCEKVLNQPGGR